MGPRSFNRGNHLLTIRILCGGNSFNGAAVFQPRKCGWPGGVRRSHGASMGPRSFNRGNVRPLRQNSRAAVLLQWGRGLSTAEILSPVFFSWPSFPASMGPRSFNRGNPMASDAAPVVTTGFNGAAVFQPRKWRRRRSARAAGGVASMGPRSFNRGNACWRLRFLHRPLQLQWGRGLSTAEMPGAIAARPAPPTLQWGRGLSTAEISHTTPNPPAPGGSFNGAAVFQPRKCVAIGAASCLKTGFNGAAVFQPRKCHGPDELSEAEQRCFNGAAVFQPRKLLSSLNAPTPGA